MLRYAYSKCVSYTNHHLHNDLCIQVYDLWTRNYRVTYPSTLYVTLKVIPVEEIDHAQSSLQPNRRSMLPMQREEGTVSYEQLVLRQQATKRYRVLQSQCSMHWYVTIKLQQHIYPLTAHPTSSHNQQRSLLVLDYPTRPVIYPPPYMLQYIPQGWVALHWHSPILEHCQLLAVQTRI